MQNRYILWGAIGAAALIGTAIYATNAKAADKGGPANIFADAPVAARSWTGCYAGIQGGVAVMDTKASLADTSPGTTTYITLDGLGATGAAFGGTFGCDVQLAKSGLVLGAWGTYDKFNQVAWNLDIMPPGGINFHTALDSQWAAGVRVGFVPFSSTMLFAKAGYSQLKMDAFSGTAGGAAIGSLSMPTFNGYVVGGGIETSMGGGWYMGAEYTAGIYQNAAVPITGSGLSLNVEPVTHTAEVTLKYKFNFTGN